MKGIDTATITRRILSGIIDYSLIFGFIYIMHVYFGVENSQGGSSLKGIPALSVFVFWFVFTVLFDYLLGFTIGNYLCNIKPVPILDTNKNLTFGQAFKRHLLDSIDLSFIGLILIATTENRQRLGDIWAKTVVINYKFK